MCIHDILETDIHVCMHTYKFAYTQLYIHMLHKYICMCTYMYVYFLHMWTCMGQHVYTFICMHLYICICMNMYEYIHIHKHHIMPPTGSIKNPNLEISVYKLAYSVTTIPTTTRTIQRCDPLSAADVSAMVIIIKIWLPFRFTKSVHVKKNSEQGSHYLLSNRESHGLTVYTHLQYCTIIFTQLNDVYNKI